MADGKIVQCIGAVVDVEFPRDAMPKVYDALKMEGSELTLEVQQQLGDGVVRTIALGTSDGLRRGMIIKNTGKAITVPVGKATLGRIMDVLGNPIDECGPVSHAQTASIHRKAPAYDELSPSQELLETGYEVAHTHLRYLNPLPDDLGDILSRYERIVVPELNLGQLAVLLQAKYLRPVRSVSKVMGAPSTSRIWWRPAGRPSKRTDGEKD